MATGGSGHPPRSSGTGQGRWPRGSLASAAAAVLARAGGPRTLDSLAAALRGEWDLGERWRGRLRRAIAQEATICRVGTATYDLVERRLTGARLRHTLTPAEIRLGLLLAHPDLEDLVQWWERHPRAGDVRWIDGAGRERTAVVTYLMGPHAAGAGTRTGANQRAYAVLAGLGDWLREEGARAGDEVCICPCPPDARRFALSLTPAAAGAVAAADARLADTALTILHAARTLLIPGDLLRRLAGLTDLRAESGVHLPVYVLGRDPRFAFDGVFYSPRELADEMQRRRIASPYPRPEDYPADWLQRDPVEEMALHMAARSGPLRDRVLAEARAELRDQMRRHPERLAGVMRERTAIWRLLLDQARLLNPRRDRRASRRAEPAEWAPRRADGATPARGKLIRGPWPQR